MQEYIGLAEQNLGLVGQLLAIAKSFA